MPETFTPGEMPRSENQDNPMWLQMAQETHRYTDRDRFKMASDDVEHLNQIEQAFFGEHELEIRKHAADLIDRALNRGGAKTKWEGYGEKDRIETILMQEAVEKRIRDILENNLKTEHNKDAPFQISDNVVVDTMEQRVAGLVKGNIGTLTLGCQVKIEGLSSSQKEQIDQALLEERKKIAELEEKEAVIH